MNVGKRLNGRWADKQNLFPIWLSLVCFSVYFGGVFIAGFDARQTLDGWREAGMILGLLGGGAYVFSRFYGNPWRERVVRVGLAGAILLILLTLIRWLDWDKNIELGLSQARLYFAYPLCIAPLLYWLYRRFSNAPPAWAESSLASVAILLTIGWLTILVGTVAASNTVKIICAGFGAVSYLIIGAHGFRALSDRNQNRVMSAPWASLCLILFVIGSSLSVTMLLPNAIIWSQNTMLADAPHEAIYCAVLALILGMGNQIAAELRGQNTRVTGWVPFWLVTGGELLTVLGLSATGLVESVLIRLEIASVGEWIAPLLAIWRGGMGLISAGLVIYGITHFLRRPRSTRAPDYPLRH